MAFTPKRLGRQCFSCNLDDGVKVNDRKFIGLLAKIPGSEKKEE